LQDEKCFDAFLKHFFETVTPGFCPGFSLSRSLNRYLMCLHFSQLVYVIRDQTDLQECIQLNDYCVSGDSKICLVRDES